MKSTARTHDLTVARRLLPALVVLALHLAAFSILLTLKPEKYSAPPEPHLVWMSFPLATRTQDNDPLLPPVAGSTLILPQSLMPSLPSLAPLDVTPRAPEDAAAATALKQYMGCHFLDANKATLEERQQCQKMLSELPASPLTDPKTTEEELQLAREKARQDASIRLPCVSATMLDVVCMLQRAMGGGSDSFIDSYAGLDAKGLNSNSGATSAGIRPNGGKPKAPARGK